MLKGKVAVVTGSTSGLARHCARTCRRRRRSRDQTASASAAIEKLRQEIARPTGWRGL